MRKMKKVIAVLVMAMALFSCYEEYITDYEYDAVYFPYPINVRTFVVGEGMDIKIGAALGGVHDNNRDRIVNYQVDNSLITPEILELMQGGMTHVKNATANVQELKPLPASYYSLSDAGKIVIKKGDHAGMVTLMADSASFVGDTLALMPNYAIGVKITSADADTVLESQSFAVIGLQYENMLFGNYWHGGVTVVKDLNGNVVDEIMYPTTIPSPEAKIWKLSTVGPMSLVTNGVSDESSSSNPEIGLTLNGGNIAISSPEGASYEVMADGECLYNQAKLLQERKIFLKYKYQNSDTTWCYATDTLTFRNRVRDGVNEWQDENPGNYE